MSRRTKVTITVSIGVFMASLDLFIVNIAFPKLEQDFTGTSLSTLSWVLNAYAIGYAALMVPAGRWADRSGRKRGFLGGMTLFTLASAGCAAAPSVGVLIGARALQSAGAALMFPTSLGLLLPEYPPEKRGAAIGIWAAVGGVAAAAGPPIGGLLVQAGWRWVFIVNVPIGLAALLAGARILNERRELGTPRPDVAGAALFTGAIAALTLAIVKGPTWGWGGSRVVGLLVTSALLVAGVALRSARHEAPLIDVVIVRTRSIALANLAALVFFTGFAAMLLGNVLFLTGVWHESVLTAGLMIAPGPLMAATFAFPGGVLGHRYGQRYIGFAGGLLFACGAAWWRTRIGSTPDYAGTMLPGQILTGIGVGLVLPTLSAAATAALPPGRFATGTAMIGMSRQLGSALGIAILVAILGTGSPTVGTFRDGWSFIIGVALAAAVVLLAVGAVRLPGTERDLDGTADPLALETPPPASSVLAA
jgi:EmrB/QacA subfamily drug resistance transporter